MIRMALCAGYLGVTREICRLCLRWAGANKASLAESDGLFTKLLAQRSV